MTVEMNKQKLPSKEIFNEVLDIKVHSLTLNGNDIWYGEVNGDIGLKKINVYEFAHKCKQEASENGYTIQTSNLLNGTGWYDVLCMDKYAIENFEDEEVDFFQGQYNTEPTAIFKAFEWILEKKKG